MFKIASCVMVVALATGYQSAQKTTPRNLLVGVWKVVEVESNGKVNSQPQPGLYMFTAQHFSIVQVTANEPRVASDPKTRTEFEALWGNNAFVASAGVYELLPDNTLATRAVVSKNPNGMSTAAFTKRRVKADPQGKTVWLTNESGQLGPMEPYTVKLLRVE